MIIKNLLSLHGMMATGHILIIIVSIVIGFIWNTDVYKSTAENGICKKNYVIIGLVFYVSTRQFHLLVLFLLIGLLCINVKFFCAHLKHGAEAFLKLGKKKTITSFLVAMALVGSILGISAYHASELQPRAGQENKKDIHDFRVYTVLAFSCLMVLTHFGQAVYLVARSHAH
ncbi:hypothetical protein niasHT_023384 [Heterodera trifolii]|uniref:Uncharacterized protein n=1 Tax=Heterodera trifolii TaxID=157864 RepID=A0ABD2K4P8_9BILA